MYGGGLVSPVIFDGSGPALVGRGSEAFGAAVFARHYRRQFGKEKVTFVSGTDEHGEKNYRAAIAAGLAPKAFVDNIAAVFRKGFDLLNISYDYFVRTTDPVHEKFVSSMLQRAYDKGETTYKDYAGLYCVGC